MRNLVGVVAVLACVALLAGGTASSRSGVSRGAPLIVGVAEDAPSFPQDGGAAIWADERSLGLAENRITVPWNPAAPTTIGTQAFLDRSLPVAAQNGISVVLDVYPSTATVLSSSAAA